MFEWLRKLSEVCELREAVQRAQKVARSQAQEAHRHKCNAEAWERSARRLRAELLGREAEDYLLRRRCDVLVHRVQELERKAHPSSGE